MSIVMTGQNRNSPLTLRLMPPEVQREALLFCSPKDLALYARVDKAAAAFRHENAASFLEFHLKNAKSLDWDKIENNIAALTHLTDTQIQNLGVEDFTRFLNELRGLVNLHEGNVKKARYPLPHQSIESAWCRGKKWASPTRARIFI